MGFDLSGLMGGAQGAASSAQSTAQSALQGAQGQAQGALQGVQGQAQSALQGVAQQVPGLPSSIPGLPGGIPSGSSALASAQQQLAALDPTGAIMSKAQAMGIPITGDVTSAIASIQAEAAKEGLDPTSLEVVTRAGTLFDEFHSIATNPSWTGAATEALKAARSFVSRNHEMTGAIDVATGLVGAFANAASGKETPADMVATFAGPLIAAAVAAGAVSAGVGAAIVGVVAIVAEILDAAGIFGHTNPGIHICDGFDYTGGGNPTLVIGCTAIFEQGPISPGSKNWRSFPNPNNSADAWWFTPNKNPKGTYADWGGARWIPNPSFMVGDDGMWAKMFTQLGQQLGLTFDQFRTPMAQMFSDYFLVTRPLVLAGDSVGGLFGAGQAAGMALATAAAKATNSLMSDEQRTAVHGFNAAFVQGWKANKEFWINGRKGNTDAAVLASVALLWNRAHEPGQGVEYVPAGNAVGVPYWQTQITPIVNQPPQSSGPFDQVLSADGTRLHINTGPLRTGGANLGVKARPTLHLGGLLMPSGIVHGAQPTLPPPAKHGLSETSLLGAAVGGGGAILLGLGPVVSSVLAGLGWIIGSKVKGK